MSPRMCTGPGSGQGCFETATVDLTSQPDGYCVVFLLADTLSDNGAPLLRYLLMHADMLATSNAACNCYFTFKGLQSQHKHYGSFFIVCGFFVLISAELLTDVL